MIEKNLAPATRPKLGAATLEPEVRRSSFSSEEISFTLFVLVLPLVGLLLFPFVRKTTKPLHAFFLQGLFYFSSLLGLLLLKGLFFSVPYFLEFLLPFLALFIKMGLVLGYVFLAALLLWRGELFEAALRRLPLLSRCYAWFCFFMFQPAGR